MTVRRAAAAGAVLLAAAALFALPLLRGYWRLRSDNPVRRGLAVASTSGCFACHGSQGSEGLPDPGLEDDGVPKWTGGVWMMYVEGPKEIREFILDGVSEKRAASESARRLRERAAIDMPAYRDLLDERDVDDLVATFLVLSGMAEPADDPAARGLEVAETWGCFACHGPAGSGGVDNPGSLTGTIPGWYGPELDDLVRSREEFDAWVTEGGIPRLDSHPVARWFLDRQTLSMPAYGNLPREDLDALWAYVRWLDRTGGGLAEVPFPEAESR